jgi:DNA polymerase elongation subunit (family B)
MCHIMSSIEFRVLDFNIKNSAEQEQQPDGENEEEETDNLGHERKRAKIPPKKTSKDLHIFEIQIFGINEIGETYSVVIEGFCPFFYVMVNDTWDSKKQSEFLQHIQVKMGPFYKNTITECFLIKRRKLYGFDGEKEHKFIKLSFTSMSALNKAKNLWYSEYLPNGKGHYLLREGYIFKDTNTRLYEANIPPLLRFLHINEISPSGWVSLPIEKVRTGCETTTCKYEFIVNVRDITPLNDKETRVPYKICSFDIEASSSHGDFPVPVKTYNKLATNIIEYVENHDLKEVTADLLKTFIHAAFGYIMVNGIDLVYPMFVPTKAVLDTLVEKWLQVRQITETSSFQNLTLIQDMFEKYKQDDEPEEPNATGGVVEVVEGYVPPAKKLIKSKGLSVMEIIMSVTISREEKIRLLDISMWTEEIPLFPQLEGDKVTFIGSTFTKYGSPEPYLNHCAVLNTCDELPMENTVIESFRTEKEVLLAWQRLIQREDPDIIIGYNIFGFDYTFMFKRAEQTDCVDEFLKLSRNRDEICATQDPVTMKYKLEESAIKLASGQHDLKFAKISGRLQVDLYNFFRREENLNSYKLDYVAGYFIGDYVKSLTHKELTNESEIKTINMTGLLVGSYVHFEEIGHSTEYYAEGAKFMVTEVNKLACSFRIDGQIHPDFTKKVRWCLAKDDVTPKDIFRMSNGTSADRSTIAKYCIQDCNLVHYLFNKVDILTGFIEMAKICSVPINFLVMRGQGIKLTSYIAKKCREKRTLMPVIEKGSMDDGYEGAIVLDPKCDLYLDNPVACVDFASLYPSCIVSENLSHDSKVWTKEYDSSGNLDKVEGEQDAEGNFIYDNLPGYEYVDIEYDTYVYVRRVPSAAAEKVRKGYKICRYAQFPDGKRAIMPSIVEELLGARKATRKLIPLQTDEFMKNVLDKRQLGYKVTANSLYGQCGAKTSTFYEMDIAAATTSTGRKLLTYAKKVIEECYGDSLCETAHHGPVRTKAEYIYG